MTPANVSVHVFLALALSQSIGATQVHTPPDEYTLGDAVHRILLTEHPRIEGLPENEIMEIVFQQLLLTPIVRSGPGLPYQVNLIEDWQANAFTIPGGRIYVQAGILPYLGDSSGLWAALLAHELGHAFLRHPYKLYLRSIHQQQMKDSYQTQAAQGSAAAMWALFGLSVGNELLGLKLSRDEENGADRLGLMTMAQAGYHPDFSLVLAQTLRASLGDQSKFSAFFSDHPRWTTREERTLRVYDEALIAFESRWPEASRSPGGVPPPVGVIGPVEAVADHRQKRLTIQVPLTLHNLAGYRAVVLALFLDKQNPVKSALTEFAGKDGVLRAYGVVDPESGNESHVVTLAIPSVVLGKGRRKLRAYISLDASGTDSKWVNLDRMNMNVEFPKP